MSALLFVEHELNELTRIMGKGKPRHNPDKPANKYGKRCPYWEEYINGTAGCEGSPLTAEQLKCQGNRHNCVKVKYHTAAILKEL